MKQNKIQSKIKAKSKGRKSSLLIVRKQNKKGQDYHINTKTGKKASSLDYSLQWNKGKRITNKSTEETINYIQDFVEPKDRADIKTRRAIQNDVLASSEARQLRKRDIAFKKNADTMDFYDIREQVDVAEKEGLKIKILHEGNDRYTEYTPAEANEIVNKFIRGINKKVYDTKSKTKIDLKGTYLPKINWIRDIAKGELKLDLKNLHGDEERADSLNIFQNHLDNLPDE
tara:strand:+ start:766 stop:1452 length:687 start_codon:yes stop_codon:yes gene_type:complete